VENKRNLIKYTGFPVKAKLKKGGKKHLNWKAVAAINLAEMAARYRDSILEEESVIEGICEEIK